ncbi:MAG: MarR family transcriptional regulator [Candidatus Pacebacteria bacterium]|nr:MarR family transcriptional regulator [Candidatus Paceibacterota bacterium]
MKDLEKKAYIFATIFTLANKLQVIGDRFDQHITTKQWLFVVGVTAFKEPPMISELANFLGYSRQNAKRIATDLQKAGFVKIGSDASDARALRIELTPKCKEFFEKRDQREIEFIEKLFTGFDSEKTDLLYEGIISLEKNIKEVV